jgi:carbon storage regulator CsrA
MLVLARKVHESILIGEDQSSPHAMKVTILEIEARRVKLGFVMADDVRVERWEVWQRLQEETTPPRGPFGNCGPCCGPDPLLTPSVRPNSGKRSATTETNHPLSTAHAVHRSTSGVIPDRSGRRASVHAGPRLLRFVFPNLCQNGFP